jgi:hypothetical protein
MSLLSVLVRLLCNHEWQYSTHLEGGRLIKTRHCTKCGRRETEPEGGGEFDGG